MAERIAAFAERVRPNCDARPDTKTEWSERCGEDADRLTLLRIELKEKNAGA